MPVDAGCAMLYRLSFGVEQEPRQRKLAHCRRDDIGIHRRLFAENGP